MSLLTTTVFYLFLFFLLYKLGAERSRNLGKKIQNITVERLMNARIVEDLIELFPVDLEIVSCRISIGGNGFKKSKQDLYDHSLPDSIRNIRPGQWMFVDTIIVMKKGSDNNAIDVYYPVELIVTKDSE